MQVGVGQNAHQHAVGQPGLLLYRYPSAVQGGYVLATTVYDDWGTTNFQASPDALTLVRDMLSWAYDPDEVLPEYSPGDVLSLPVSVQRNRSVYPISSPSHSRLSGAQ